MVDAEADQDEDSPSNVEGHHDMPPNGTYEPEHVQGHLRMTLTLTSGQSHLAESHALVYMTRRTCSHHTCSKLCEHQVTGLSRR